jgi:hypothetical protein
VPSLLAPAFLAGLLAVVVPILVHLRMRERKTSQPLPSLMFVRRIPHKSFRRRTLQDLLLFAARALAIILLSLAFARPFFPRNALGLAAAAGPVGRIVALDVSASMRYEGVFARGLAEAERAIREVRPGDSIGVLLFSDSAQGVVPPSTDHAKALAALSDASPGVRATRFAPALRLAGDWLGALKVDRREVVMITDGQTRALTGVSEVGLPANTVVTVRPVTAPNSDNAAVADVSVEHAEEGDRNFAVVTARLIHQGPAEKSIRASLEVAGRVIEEKSVTLPSNGATGVTFTKAPLPAGASTGRIVLKTDALEVDNAFHFVLGGGGDVHVLLVDPSPYVGRALEIGTEPSFDIERRSTLAASDLVGRSLVVLGDTGSGLGAPASAALLRFVREGGGLLATAPLLGLRGDAALLLPGPFGESVNRLADRGASLGFVDLEHPALFAFKQARGSDFSRARFLQYRQLKTTPGRTDGESRVLARFDDGREALVETRIGAGRVLAFTSALDGVMSDLPVQPLFLPLIHELARYASAHKDAPLYHRVGDAVNLREKSEALTPLVTFVTSPSGRKEKLADGVSGIELQEVGFYESVTGTEARRIIAVNADTAESDLTALDQGELQAAVRPAGSVTEAESASTPAEAGERQSWWRLALLSVAVLMVLETILGNLRGQKAASSPS